jgi:hypothetical protein
MKGSFKMGHPKKRKSSLKSLLSNNNQGPECVVSAPTKSVDAKSDRNSSLDEMGEKEFKEVIATLVTDGNGIIMVELLEKFRRYKKS